MRKIRAGRQLFSFYGARYRLSHVVISPPPEYARFIGIRKGYDLLMEDFYRVADAFDMHGFMILHPWRGKKDDESDVSLIVQGEDLDASDYWRLGPHAHSVAFCDPQRIVEAAEEFYNATGWVIKVVAEDMDELYAENVLSYALSHCGIGHWDGHKDLKTLHPFGYLATSKENGLYMLAEVRDEAKKTCSECGGFLYDTHELDLRLEEDELVPATVPLHHEIYVRRNEREGHKIMIEGMSDSQILEYARARIYDVAIVYDDRPTVVSARCDVAKAIEADIRKPGYWRAPRRGQSLITPFRTPPRLGGAE